MDLSRRLEVSLDRVVTGLSGPDCPPRLARALRHSLFPAGARVRPRLMLAVADACGADLVEPASRDALVDLAIAIELLHCASLVQDDLDCFDGALVRRGEPAVHVAFDERLAILASDALIVAAFGLVADADALDAGRRLAVASVLARCTGAAGGIAAGQAWESEEQVDLERYHASKTGALFAAATEAGAAAAGVPVRERAAWSSLGARVGAAFQIADDLKDVVGDAAELGKPVNVDARLERPSAVSSLGLEGAANRFDALVDQLAASVPECPGRARFAATMRAEALRFMPSALASAVAELDAA